MTSTDGSGGNGWYYRLANNEKILASADVFDGTVFSTSFTPAVTVTCDGAGTARLYAVQAGTGYGALDWPTGEKLPSSDSSEPRSVIVGSGIPGKPAIVTTITNGIAETKVVTGTSDNQLVDQTVDPVPLKRILFWREVF